MNAPRFDNIMLKTKTVGAEATKDGILVTFEGEQAPKEPQLYDLVLQAVGRSPNGKKIGAEKAGVARHRPRLHPGRHPDAHQRAAHLRHRRHRRPADAGAQGGARGACGGRGAPARATELQRAFNARVIPERRLHRSRSGLGRPDRGPGQGRGHRRSRRACSPGRPPAGRSPTAATRASPSCCSTRRRTASSAAASSARMPAT